MLLEFLKEWKPKFDHSLPGLTKLNTNLILDKSYSSLLNLRDISRTKKMNNLDDKNYVKNFFNFYGFKTAKKIFYTDHPTDLLYSAIEKLDTFVVKPCHLSESYLVHIIVDGYDNSTHTKANKKDICNQLNASLSENLPAYLRTAIINSAKKGILVEDYIKCIFELKIFVLWGTVAFIDLRTGYSEEYRLDIIGKNSKLIHCPHIYEQVEKLANDLKIDFFRIDFIFDGKDFYAGEFAFSPSTILPYEITEFIGDKWLKGYKI